MKASKMAVNVRCLIASILCVIGSAYLSSCTGNPLKNQHKIQALKINQILQDLNQSEEVKEALKEIKENSEENKKLCEKDNRAKSCMKYALYHELTSLDYGTAYDYYLKAFDLGYKNAGYHIGYSQLHRKQIFNKKAQPSIDETISYLEESFKAGAIDASAQLTVIYREPEYNRINLKKSEYYNLALLNTEVATRRTMLASLYLIKMKDKSKVDFCIKMLNGELLEERSIPSAQLLSLAYFVKDDSHRKQDFSRPLAYSYISKDLGYTEKTPPVFYINDKELPPEQIQRAKEIYQEIKAEMDEYAKKNAE